jgi:hypothetical protein
LHLQTLVEVDRVLEEGQLESSVSLGRGSGEAIWLEMIEIVGEELSMRFPLMLPEEGSRAGGLDLRGPVVVQVVQELDIFLEEGDVKASETFATASLGPYSMDGVALAEF